jgi:hypothetical protein
MLLKYFSDLQFLKEIHYKINPHYGVVDDLYLIKLKDSILKGSLIVGKPFKSGSKVVTEQGRARSAACRVPSFYYSGHPYDRIILETIRLILERDNILQSWEAKRNNWSIIQEIKRRIGSMEERPAISIICAYGVVDRSAYQDYSYNEGHFKKIDFRTILQDYVKSPFDLYILQKCIFASIDAGYCRFNRTGTTIEGHILSETLCNLYFKSFVDEAKPGIQIFRYLDYWIAITSDNNHLFGTGLHLFPSLRFARSSLRYSPCRGGTGRYEWVKRASLPDGRTPKRASAGGQSELTVAATKRENGTSLIDHFGRGNSLMPSLRSLLYLKRLIIKFGLRPYPALKSIEANKTGKSETLLYFGVYWTFCYGSLFISIPIKPLIAYLSRLGFCDRQGRPAHNGKWVHLEVPEIIIKYNRYLNTILDYYLSLITSIDKKDLNTIQHLFLYSLAKTLAVKFKTTIAKLFGKYGKNLDLLRGSERSTTATPVPFKYSNDSRFLYRSCYFRVREPNVKKFACLVREENILSKRRVSPRLFCY